MYDISVTRILSSPHEINNAMSEIPFVEQTNVVVTTVLAWVTRHLTGLVIRAFVLPRQTGRVLVRQLQMLF
jgi:hypothetical protein